VLIMASGSLILTTSQRLGRVIERTRKLTEYLRNLVQTEERTEHVIEEELHKATKRAKLLQRAMTFLYITLSVFVATSIVLSITDVLHMRYMDTGCTRYCRRFAAVLCEYFADHGIADRYYCCK
jgi:hypothetical protein